MTDLPDLLKRSPDHRVRMAGAALLASGFVSGGVRVGLASQFAHRRDCERLRLTTGQWGRWWLSARDLLRLRIWYSGQRPCRADHGRIVLGCQSPTSGERVGNIVRGMDRRIHTPTLRA